jgi:hypothetical protein
LNTSAAHSLSGSGCNSIPSSAFGSSLVPINKTSTPSWFSSSGSAGRKP